MAFSMQISSNIGEWMVRWNKRVAELEKKTKATPNNVAEWGAKYAKSIAPKDTTAMAQSISWTGTKQNTAMIYLRSGYTNPKDHKDVKKYALIMHKTPLARAKKIWYSGDPHYMFTVRKGAKKQFSANINTAIGEFLGKPKR